VDLAADADRHWFAIGDRHPHFIACNPRLNRPPAPTHRERDAEPFRWQLRIEGERVTIQREAGESEYYRLPQTPQSGDPYAAGAVRVQFKVRGRGLAWKTKGGFGCRRLSERGRLVRPG
jgi:hypothetical protein